MPRRPRCAIPAATALAIALSACSPPPPAGLTPPTASEAADESVRAPSPLTLPPDRRLVVLRISIEGEPEDLLDDAGAGVLVMRPDGQRKPAGLVFFDGAMTAHVLPTGVYRIETIAGYDCGPIYLTLSPREAPLALGTLTLTAGEESAGLSGAPPTDADLAVISDLLGIEPGQIEARPLERRQRVTCTRRPLAVARPDIDPTARVLTPAEIAGAIVLVGVLGAVTGGAIASGTIVFTSGAAGGTLFLAL